MMKRFIRVAMLLWVVTVLLSTLSLKTAGAKATTASGRVSQHRFSSNSCLLAKWSVVPSPNPNGPNILNGVAAVSASDIWAVGGTGNQATGVGQTLIEHWDGVQWQMVTSPNPGSIYNALYAVTAVSESDAWAIGYEVNTTGVTQTLVEHWNGTSWSVVKSPNPGSMNNELFSVAAASASDLEQTTLIEHWNGARWSVMKNPSPGSNDVLSGVAAVSASDVWAVGESNTFAQTLVEHWNGKSWSVVTGPNPGSGGVLQEVAAVSASDVWAAGYYSPTSNSIQTLVEHWDGTSWQAVKSPTAGTSSTLWAVAAVSANDVWAVGSDNTSTGMQALTEQWNGKHWSIVTSPSPGSFSTQLLGVAAISSTNVWAVGHADSSTLVEHYQC
jgi:hypothetical protein